MTKGWLKLEKSLLKVVQVKNVMTGESIEWTHIHTILFLYMQDRHKHFKKMGNAFYDNQENIAQETGISLASLKRRLKELYRIGAVRVEKKKLSGFLNSNAYVVLDVFHAPMFEAVTADGEILEKFTEAKEAVKVPSYRNPENIQTGKVVNNSAGVYDPEEPF